MTHETAPVSPRSTLVITAHAGDFVWRAWGAVALAALRGEKFTIACLTFGERGESAKAWREGRKLDEIKAIRREEAERAAFSSIAIWNSLSASASRPQRRSVMPAL